MLVLVSLRCMAKSSQALPPRRCPCRGHHVRSFPPAGGGEEIMFAPTEPRLLGAASRYTVSRRRDYKSPRWRH